MRRRASCATAPVRRGDHRSRGQFARSSVSTSAARSSRRCAVQPATSSTCSTWRSLMQRFGLRLQPDQAVGDRARRARCRLVSANGAQAWAAESGETESLVERLADTECLIVLGGDGTFLRAARALARVDVPVLGVNSGRVGFLSKIDPAALESTLGRARPRRVQDRVADDARGDARFAPRARRCSGRGGPFAALNDAAIVRGGEARVLRMEVLIDGSHLATYIADGVVIATPTGSTAYSFSAGGPILDPTARNLVVTPVAAYLASRPLDRGRSAAHGPRSASSTARPASSASTAATTTRSSRATRSRFARFDRPLRFIEPHTRCRSGSCCVRRRSCCRRDGIASRVTPRRIRIT